jgi:hypothetical protein
MNLTNENEVKKMKKLLYVVIMICVLVIGGCGGTGTPGTGDTMYISCTDAVAYISAMDAAIASLPAIEATMPENAVEIRMAKAWYMVARSGAVAYIARKCPEVLPSLPGAPS